MDIDFICVALMLHFHTVLATASYNFDVVDANSSWVMELGGRTDFQLAAVGRDSGHLFVAARDRLLMLDAELNLLRSVSVVPRCRRRKQFKQLVTPCARHNDAKLLALLPTDRLGSAHDIGPVFFSLFRRHRETVTDPEMLKRGGGGRQCVIPVGIYRKCM